jgi:hypothetical protein
LSFITRGGFTVTRSLTALLFAGALAAAASAQSQPTGTYNYNNPLYHGVYPPTGYYPGGVVSEHAYTNPGDTVPTTYISHYRSLPPRPVYVQPVPVGGYLYTETVRYGGFAPPRYFGRGRWR